MSQLELIDKSIISKPSTDWIGADDKVLAMQKHPNFAVGELISYKVVPSIYDSTKVLVYDCISKDRGKKKNPYHYGNIHHTLTGGLYDAIEREYQLGNPGWWMINKPLKDPHSQWRPWIWKNDEVKKEFMEWHADHFYGWTKEKWKDKGHTWKREDRQIEQAAEPVPVIEKEAIEQLTLF
ncbi:hypothetical protein [Paenibacillus cucumis (ex Kampfer et al. 2016)]|uniref:Uncharacterized protein n=1 Tax=Paenibacillus cucumis (ex Kampfer et al. 2016) TaxID=1776858 RepID=A0ABS7KMG9_9BACL|nr:hypothetical protein [Paenibacillus cucumis (ex Kampfer et al. 2016)]MBY0205289.1 hypothetical protein [Paenibacillus cucumis (ex Kampfer et al. 2016)]